MFAYGAGVAIIWAFFFFEDELFIERFLTPITIPFAIADYLFPDRGEQSVAFDMVLGFGGNALIYGAPIYGILSVLQLFGKTKNDPATVTPPPPPPLFDR